MRLRLGILVGALALLMPGAARAETMRFNGDATVELVELLVPGDFQQIDVSIVDLTIEMRGARATGSRYAYAAGQATVTRGDGSETTIPLWGAIAPPEGSGGEAALAGHATNGDYYCFWVVDQSDAPTTRPDRVTAVYEPAERYVGGHLLQNLDAIIGDPAGGLPLVPVDRCLPMSWREGPPLAGDFWFNTII